MKTTRKESACQSLLPVLPVVLSVSVPLMAERGYDAIVVRDEANLVGLRA